MEVVMSTTFRCAVLSALLMLTCAGIAQAQTVKKYVTPDGKTIYSDEPVPGAREVGVIAPPPEVSEEDRQAAEEAAQRDAERANEAGQSADEGLSRREQIREAEQQLEAAKRTLEQGKEPLPGERKGTAGGGSRLTEAYFERQKANEIAVQKAEQKLQSARSRR
jgi:hypothetical protein